MRVRSTGVAGGLQPAGNRRRRRRPDSFNRVFRLQGAPQTDTVGRWGSDAGPIQGARHDFGADSCPRLPLPPACPELRLGRFKSRHLVRGTHLP